jgi:hypothetical protein
MLSRKQRAVLRTAIVVAALGTGTLLQGCASNTVIGTLDAGAALPRATYQVLGKTRYDQLWIDKTIEGEVAGFGFGRPLRRPAGFDAAPASHIAIALPATPATFNVPATPAVVTVVPKRTWRQRIGAEYQKIKGGIKSEEQKLKDKLHRKPKTPTPTE